MRKPSVVPGTIPSDAGNVIPMGTPAQLKVGSPTLTKWIEEKRLLSHLGATRKARHLRNLALKQTHLLHA